jgi:phosphoribosylamine--glycine ligase
MPHVVVVGSGGREHALQSLLSRNAHVSVLPGNPGTPGSVDTNPLDIEADLFVIGPEQPLVEGLADDLRAKGKLVFGPGRDGAALEGSKQWMKDVVMAAGVPTASHVTFGSAEVDMAVAYLEATSGPYVIKTDGLAAGKGVLVTDNLASAVTDVTEKLSGRSFGAAGSRVVIEEALSGPEVSLFAVCDGNTAVPISTLAQDHKRLGDNNTGPNTGGMGCYSPVPGLAPTIVEDLMRIAVHPTMDVL